MNPSRLAKELQLLEEDPPHGVAAWPVDDRLDKLEAQLQGPKDTPYENGIFKLEIGIPERYPIEPPKVRFVTPIYHPNIDSGGRICLDTLNMPPKGAWTCSLNLHTVLSTISVLVSEPNPDDGLMADITQEYKHNRSKFLQTAREWTQKYAMQDIGAGSSSSPSSIGAASAGATGVAVSVANAPSFSTSNSTQAPAVRNNGSAGNKKKRSTPEPSSGVASRKNATHNEKNNNNSSSSNPQPLKKRYMNIDEDSSEEDDGEDESSADGDEDE